MARLLSSPAFILCFFAFIFVLHVTAGLLGWYEPGYAFDNLHHVLGGAWIASLFFYSFLRVRKVVNPGESFFGTLALAVGFTLIAGVSWELFEFARDLVFVPRGFSPYQPGLADTMGDLFFDASGGLVFSFAYLFSERRERRSNG